jgi:hypothetical protein
VSKPGVFDTRPFDQKFQVATHFDGKRSKSDFPPARLQSEKISWSGASSKLGGKVFKKIMPILRTIAFVPAFAEVIASAAAADAPRNAVNNPGFETGLELWDTVGTSGTAVDAAVAHSGRQSACVTGSTLQSIGGIHQSIRFAQTFQHPIVVSGWSKALEVKTDGGIYAIFLEGRYDDNSPIPRQGVTFDTGTHDWQYRKFTIDPPRPVKSLELVANPRAR